MNLTMCLSSFIIVRHGKILRAVLKEASISIVMLFETAPKKTGNIENTLQCPRSTHYSRMVENTTMILFIFLDKIVISCIKMEVVIKKKKLL